MNKDIEGQIKSVEERLRQAMLASDVTALDELLAPELIFTNHFGQCLGKEADIAAHKSGALSIFQLTLSEQQIKVLSGDVAVVSVRAQITGEYEGQPAGGGFRFTRVWARSPRGNWQVEVAHSGKVN